MPTQDKTTAETVADTAPETSADTAAPHGRVLVWDWPTRSFHGLLAFSFVGAYLTAETERWRLVHVTLGYTVGALVVFRLLWGLLGTRHARFSAFLRGPLAVKRYLASLLRGQPEHHTGHNPAGALAIVAMLGLGLLAAATGWALYNDLGPEALEDLHELAANSLLAVVLLHVGGVVVASLLHRENLARGMLSGHKRGAAHEAIPHARHSVAVLMLAAVFGFWAWQAWQAPQLADLAQAGSPAVAADSGRRGHDDDD